MHYRRVLQDEEGLLNFNSWKSHQRLGVNTAIHTVLPPRLPLAALLPQRLTHPHPCPLMWWSWDSDNFFWGGEERNVGKKNMTNLVEKFLPGYFHFPQHLILICQYTFFPQSQWDYSLCSKYWVLRVVSRGWLFACENAISILPLNA